MTKLMWFRNDLRVSDNPALSAAMAAGPTMAVWCITQRQWQRHHMAASRRTLLINQVRELVGELAQINVPLVVLNCDDFDGIEPQLTALCASQQIDQLFYNHEYELNELACSRQVTQALRRQGVTVTALHDQCIVAPGQLRTGQGGYYHVFSAFKRAFIRQFDQQAREVAKRPVSQYSAPCQSDLSPLLALNVDEYWSKQWPAGEHYAYQQLLSFTEQCIHQYHRVRDFPAIDDTSRLAPYLAIGALSTRQCLELAIQANQGDLSGGNPGIDSWINELIWREFYRHLLVAYPDLCRHKPFKSDTDRLPWRHDQSMFNAWCEGRTGFPLVDAAMQQLVTTGWMHNRLRMVVAMFLTKHLFIDWRWGERFFMQHLVDGDFASNNGGWQWSASTGVDAVPYFRIFNPTRQSERFDPDGEFIRRYLPGLAGLDNKSIHQPNPVQAESCGYPAPIVDHRQAVSQCKSWFKELAVSQQDI